MWRMALQRTPSVEWGGCWRRGTVACPQLAAAHKEQIFILSSHLNAVEINSAWPGLVCGALNSSW